MPDRTPAETATYREIVTQPQAWQQAIEVVDEGAEALAKLWQTGFDDVLFTGCGSTYYLSLAAAALLQKLVGVPARGVPAGELVLYPSTGYAPHRRTLLVAVSRSAETSETIQAVKDFRRERQGEVIVITNYGDRPLAELATLSIAIPAGQEESIAQTRSFASMHVALTAIAALLSLRGLDMFERMRGLPEMGKRLIGRYGDLAQSLGSNLDLDRFYVLGSGPRYGLACEASLKMKEMTLTHSEPFHFFEFRHGPKSMVCGSALVVGLLSELHQAREGTVLKEMAALGGHTLSLGEHDADVTFGSGLPAAVRNVLYLPVLQLLACHRAIAKGLNPDRPTNLDAVVKLELGS
jgi:glucosamine--fructose-6-phosphate aminotransferase (isomerizing)